jgi:hypothetical protein
MNLETRNSDGSLASVSENNPLPIHVTGATIFGQIKPTNYLYVGKNGNDTSGDGSAGNPYLTISTAITAGSSGTTIFIFPGTYVENLTLKAGVYLTSPVKFGVYITGNHIANFTGTIIIDGIILQSSTGTTLTFSGTGAQNLQLLGGSSVNSGTGDAIAWTNTNANSKIYFEDGTCNVTTSGATARCFYSTVGAAGSFIANRVSFKLNAAGADNVCLAIGGAVSFTHTSDTIYGQVTVSDTASALIALVTMTAATVPVITTNSTGTTSLINDTVVTTASPAITGAGVFYDVALLYASTGVGGADTLNGGYGPLSLPMSSVKLRASGLVPAGQVALGYNTGAFEFDGTDLYFTEGAVRAALRNSDQYLTTPTNNIIRVDNGRTDDYTPDGGFTKPYKSVPAALASITDSSATNTYAILIALGLPYTGDITIDKDYVTLVGESVSKGAGYTGTITITSQHSCLEKLHFNTGTVINLSLPGHFLFEIKNCRLSHTTINVAATGTVEEKADAWFQITGAESTLWLVNTVNISGVMGEAAILSGAYESNVFTATGSIFTMNAATVLTNTVNVEAGTTGRIKAMSAKDNTINLKPDGTLYADITALANDGNTLVDTGGTLYRISDAQVLAAFSNITDAATGDIFYLDASKNLVRLAAPATASTLHHDGTAPYWA